MYKLVILFEPVGDMHDLEDRWPEFLRMAEEMPKLRREATSHVERHLFGDVQYAQMHELFFDTLADLKEAMNSKTGRQAGIILQQITKGRIVLFFAEHKEDSLENIQKHRRED